jgi:hypothetical protein
MAVDSSGLVRAAMELRAASPAMWAGFVGAMEEYAHAMTQEMVKAAPEMLLRAQGMSIMAHEIAGILMTAPQMLDKMQQLQRGRADGRRPVSGAGF